MVTTQEHVDLNRVPRLRLFEELHLARHSRARAAEPRQLEYSAQRTQLWLRGEIVESMSTPWRLGPMPKGRHHFGLGTSICGGRGA